MTGPSKPKRLSRESTLNKEMIAAGVRKFACGLSPKATTLRAQPNGEVLLTDGLYLETKEHLGGLSILETADLDEVLAWASKGAKACRAAVEVRRFSLSRPSQTTERYGNGELVLRSGVFETRLATDLNNRRNTSERRRQAHGTLWRLCVKRPILRRRLCAKTRLAQS